MSRFRFWEVVLLIGLFAVPTADARVLRVEIDRRVEVLGGQSSNPTGPTN